MEGWIEIHYPAPEGDPVNTSSVSDTNAPKNSLGILGRRRNPCFDSLHGTDAYRVPSNLDNTDRIMNDTFWVGVYPGLSDRDIERMINAISGAVA